jgi:hypothetical protein
LTPSRRQLWFNGHFVIVIALRPEDLGLDHPERGIGGFAAEDEDGGVGAVGQLRPPQPEIPKVDIGERKARRIASRNLAEIGISEVRCALELDILDGESTGEARARER